MEPGPATHAQPGDTDVASDARLRRLLEWVLPPEGSDGRHLQVRRPASKTVGTNVCCPSPGRGAGKGLGNPFPGSRHPPPTAGLGRPPGAHSARASSKGGSRLEVPAASQKTQGDPRDLSPVPPALNPVFSTLGSRARGAATPTHGRTVSPRFRSWSVPAFRSQPKRRPLSADVSTHRSADRAPRSPHTTGRCVEWRHLVAYLQDREEGRSHPRRLLSLI